MFSSKREVCLYSGYVFFLFDKIRSHNSKVKDVRDHPFSMYEKFSEILTFFPLIHRRRNVSFWENSAYIPNG